MFVGIVLVYIYIAVCFGIIARSYGKNGFWYGMLSIVSPVNLIVLGVWAYKRYETLKSKG